MNATCTDHPYRATLSMHAAGYPDREIADTLTIPVRSVRQRRHELRTRCAMLSPSKPERSPVFLQARYAHL